jgi:hypothetical protein
VFDVGDQRPRRNDQFPGLIEKGGLGDPGRWCGLGCSGIEFHYRSIELAVLE